MGKINKEWHAGNRMPKNPTPEQRIEWHTKHTKNCAPAVELQKLLREMKKGSR
jgi:hypothetical protein